MRSVSLWFVASAVLFTASTAQAQRTAAKPGGRSAAAQRAGTAQKPAAEPQWQLDLERYHDQLVTQNGQGTDPALQSELLEMGAQDQQARGYVHGEAVDKAHMTTSANLNEVDATLTAKLKQFIAANGWPTIHLVGLRASNAAMLVLIHTRDHEWQRSLLPELEKLSDDGKIDGSYVSTLVDKELISEGKLQRYGTQYKMLDGSIAMYATEDPGTLDERRARVGLPPSAPYAKMMSAMYHLPVSKQVVLAAAPAPDATKESAEGRAANVR